MTTLRPNPGAGRHQLAAWLYRQAAAVAEGAAGDHPSAMIVFFGADAPPAAASNDHRKVSEVRRDWWAASSVVDSALRRPQADTYAESFAVEWERAKRHKASADARSEAAKSEKPWVCDHCDRRFETERGANQHERGCIRGTREHHAAGRRRTPDGIVFVCSCMAEMPGESWNRSTAFRAHIDTTI